jgi:hypothetical protein
LRLWLLHVSCAKKKVVLLLLQVLLLPLLPHLQRLLLQQKLPLLPERNKFFRPY